ncbi:MAG: monoheme cytochrome C [Flavobacteriaceae bacterium]|nr:monoheme cytochrome C [Flavobacteriaceae bacterium]
MSNLDKLKKKSKRAKGFFILTLIIGIGLLLYFAFLFFNQSSSENQINAPKTKEDIDKIENGIHVRTGLKNAIGLMAVVNNCTNCHSAQLVIQNRMNKDRWDATIKWMQETQNLWPLGDNQEIIVNYLITNYPPIDKGRREALKNLEWYDLNE